VNKVPSTSTKFHPTTPTVVVKQPVKPAHNVAAAQSSTQDTTPKPVANEPANPTRKLTNTVGTDVHHAPVVNQAAPTHKASAVGVFFAKDVALPDPRLILKTLLEMPPSVCQADADALWALGEAQGKIRNGVLHPLELMIPDRRLHAAVVIASFELATGSTRDELAVVMRDATVNHWRGLTAADPAHWPLLVARMEPREREVFSQAMTAAKVPASTIRSLMSTKPNYLISAKDLDTGLQRTVGGAAMKILRLAVEGNDDDNFVQRLRKELPALPLPAGDEGDKLLAVAAHRVFTTAFVTPSGDVDVRHLQGPGPKPTGYYNRTFSHVLMWEALAANAHPPEPTKRAQLAKELRASASLIASATDVSVEAAEQTILGSLNQRNGSDSYIRSLTEDWTGFITKDTGQPVSLEGNLHHHLKQWNDAAASIPQSLPMVDAAKKRIPDDAFAGHLVLTVQHFLGPFVPLMNALKDKGAKTSDMIHVGVPYSANAQVELALLAAGNDVRVPSSIDQMKASIRNAMEDIIARSKASGQPILVIDDGGTVTELLQEVFPHEVDRFCIIEQTTRGITAANKAIEAGKATGFKPAVIVDVARSEAKCLEGVQIAPTAMAAIEPAINARAQILHGRGLPVTTLANTKPLVFGFGVIGAAMAQAFKDRGLDVAVWDESPQRREEARAAGFFVPETRDEVFKGRDLVVGCTGFPSIRASDMPKMDSDALVVSLSSKRIEFDEKIKAENADWSINWRDKETKVIGLHTLGSFAARATIGTSEQLSRANNHRLLQLTIGAEAKRGPIIVNDMQPINFDHDVFVVPADQIQLTETLLLDGAYQAVRDKKQSGIIPYDLERQKHVLEDWKIHAPKM
jgi:S-adenosylhomocysteine hydrolase